MEPTTRRVTAQRKFAQGAYVPPAMATTPSTSTVAAATAVRREAHSATHEKNGTVICNPMSAKQLLDLVCFQGTHHHLQPIVLVERLREENNESGSNATQKVRKDVGSKIWKRTRPRPHIMKLRARDHRCPCLKLISPVVLPNVTKFLTQKPKRAKHQPKRVISKPKRVKPQQKPKKAPRSGIKRKIPRRFTRDGSEFSLDDNRPLKYFAKSSTPNAAQVNTLMGPPTKIPPRARLPSIDKLNDSIGNVPTSDHLASKEGRAVASKEGPATVSKERPATVSKDGPAAASEAGPSMARYSRAGPTLAGYSRAGPTMAGYSRAGPSMAGYSRAGPSMAGYSRAGPSMSGYLKAGPSMAGYSRAGPSSAKYSSSGPSSAGYSRAGPSMAGYSRAGPSVAGPLKAGPSKAGPSKAGPSKAGPSKAGPSKAGLSNAGPSMAEYLMAGPSKAGPSMAENSKAGPSKAGPSRKRPAATTSSVSACEPSSSLGSQQFNLMYESEPTNSLVCEPDSVSEHSYYSEEEIHRWMDDSLPECSEQGVSPRLLENGRAHSTRQSKPEPPRAPETPLGCPAVVWDTVKDVAEAPKMKFNSRCKMCKPCKSIDKVMQITMLLKRQKKIDCFDVEANGQSAEASSSSAADGIRCIIIDLIPMHPHLMIKIKIQNNLNGRQIYHSCLIPRTDSTVTNGFLLTENDEILKQVIINLSLSCGDRPPASEADDASLRGGPVYRPDSPEFTKTKPDPIEEDNGEIIDAPAFYPTKEEFADPLTYIDKIWNEASVSGICKICPPPDFFPPCKADDDIRFEVSNQYISRLYIRWGPAARKLSAIKASVQAQGVDCSRPLKLEGVELNLPRLYHTVQRLGGLEEVFNERKWGKVSDELKLNTNPFTIRKLERIYTKYLLPYDTLSTMERREFMRETEFAWNRKQKRLLKHACNPLHQQKCLLGDSESSGDEDDGREEPHEAEDCVTRGINMNLAQFKKIASITFDNFFRNKAVSTKEIENEYWSLVLSGSDHVCVNSASIDTGELGLGFTKNRNDAYSRHPWNLKMLSENELNVLRSLGPALGVTVPTLHLGMIFSTSCWHRDPHSIPWIEYLHQGPIKIWYGVPESQDAKFRTITELVHPTACLNKSLWLPSDISMVPPTILRQQTVKVYRVEQKPGEFVLVMPRAYSSSICTGYSISESTYFATDRWLMNFMSVFNEIRESCEPTMFALEQLLKSIAEDPRTSIDLLKKIQPALDIIFHQEILNRQELEKKGIKVKNESAKRTRPTKRKYMRPPARSPTPPVVWNVRDLDECELCRCTLYLSKVKNLPLVNSMVCLTDALLLLSKPKFAKVKVSDLEMLCAYTTDEIMFTMSNAHRRIGQFY